MGLISTIFQTLFGGGGNVVKEVIETIRPNAEARSSRSHELDSATLAQLAAEFQHERKGLWDRFFDGLNRLPRPLMVLSVFGLLIYTPIDPLRMTEVFTAWSLIPPGLWAIAGVIVTFYFGGRAQIKAQDFQKELVGVAARAPSVIEVIGEIRDLRADSPNIAADETPEAQAELTAPVKPLTKTGNAAIEDFAASRKG
jgi:hypothetical protein